MSCLFIHCSLSKLSRSHARVLPQPPGSLSISLNRLFQCKSQIYLENCKLNQEAKFFPQHRFSLRVQPNSFRSWQSFVRSGFCQPLWPFLLPSATLFILAICSGHTAGQLPRCSSEMSRRVLLCGLLTDGEVCLDLCLVPCLIPFRSWHKSHLFLKVSSTALLQRLPVQSGSGPVQLEPSFKNSFLPFVTTWCMFTSSSGYFLSYSVALDSVSLSFWSHLCPHGWKYEEWINERM